jgi:hypothetical protein
MELKVAAHTTEIGGSLDPERQAHVNGKMEIKNGIKMDNYID